MTAPDGLHALVENFSRNADAYRSGRYNETQVRVDFINPFFELLGWDVSNRQGLTPAYQDVVHEDAIKVGGGHKAPDYGFRVGGARRFFVEAKKPSVNLRDDANPAFQLRRYAWSAKLPLSILTDFEEFAVYDCRVTPDKDDKPSNARILFHTYEEYSDRWDDIAGIFSRDAILDGSFDTYAEAATTKRGTSTVDAVFLKEIESWREHLAKDLVLNNSGLTRRELNFAVQMTIDRIIFLRITEDRGIEQYGRLQALLNGSHVYERLRELYRQADERYNSGLFHFHAEKNRSEHHDELTLRLTIGDEPLKRIVRNLYYPDSPYEFSVLPIEVLGQVYEQFLGKVIDISPNREVTIEEKPEVRKAGGVYYTPKYIVDYIVQHTVGTLLEGKKPGPRGAVNKLKIVDPACGSGSFLIGAYEYLLDWHRDRYIEDGPEKHRKELFQGLGEQWLLTTTEKKRILLNNIYGVDIDPQAVEVTKLSLLLKMLEAETAESLITQLTMFRERTLPDLSNNIKCGNSLIGPDYYDNQQMALLDDEEQHKINVFDWKAAFRDVFAGDNPGFDAVIGNPPYLGGREWKEEGGRRYDYFIAKYKVAEYQFDIYALFWERSVNLLKRDGLVSLITPNTWLNNQSNKKLREFVLQNTSVLSITDYSRVKVFPGVVVLPIVTLLKRSIHSGGVTQVFVPTATGVRLLHRVPEDLWKADENRIFNIGLRAEDAAIRQKIESVSDRLDSLALIKFGIKLYETGKGVPPQQPSDAKEHIFEADTRLSPEHRPYLEGKDIQRYEINWKDRWLRYGVNLAAPRDPNLFAGSRILVRRIVGERLISAFTNDDFVTSQLLQIVKPHDQEQAQFLLGVLNSNLMAYYFKKKFNRQDKTFPEIRIYELASLPIANDSSTVEAGKSVRGSIVDSALKLATLKLHFNSVRTSHDRNIINQQIEATDRQIDRLVYELYGLTDEEIAIVEKASEVQTR